MIKHSWFLTPALALCFLLSGCFTSERPLFDQRTGSALLGGGDVRVTGHSLDPKKQDVDAKDSDVGVLHWSDGVYIDMSDKDKATLSFHRLPGTWPWDGWYVGETQMNDESGKGYLYELYRKDDGRLLIYNVACSDLTDLEAERTHMVRTQSGVECKTNRQSDLAMALRLLIKRKKPESYWTYEPAPPLPK
jgi:hypothetical protein